MKKRIIRLLALALVLSMALPLLYACELPTVNKTAALFAKEEKGKTGYYRLSK